MCVGGKWHALEIEAVLVGMGVCVGRTTLRMRNNVPETPVDHTAHA